MSLYYYYQSWLDMSPYELDSYPLLILPVHITLSLISLTLALLVILLIDVYNNYVIP